MPRKSIQLGGVLVRTARPFPKKTGTARYRGTKRIIPVLTGMVKLGGTAGLSAPRPNRMRALFVFLSEKGP